jgi:hypothetical protein
MIYYKVTTAKLESLAVSQNGLAQDFVVTYELNAWVYPKHKKTKLFVFDDYTQALHFAQDQSCDNYKIWECEVLNPTTEYNLFIPVVYSRDFVDKLKNMLIEGFVPTIRLWLRQHPSTVFVDAVKLTKLIRSFDGNLVRSFEDEEMALT